jgi:iron complex outermembrane receptor protein
LPELFWNFVNYNIGIEYHKNNIVFYYSYGVNNREPSRNDIFNGYNYLPCDTLGNPVYNNIHSEKSKDIELGFRVDEKNLYFNFNFFYMNFNNEIVLNGKIGTSGVPLHDNVSQSYRQGFEADFKYKFDFGFGVNINGAYNDCGIRQANTNITPILSPKWIGNFEGYYKYKWFVVGLAYRYQDYSIIGYTKYLGADFAETIGSYYTLNGKIGINWKWLDFSFFVNNITNQKYFASGQLNWDGTKPLYFVGAPVNYFASLKIIIMTKREKEKEL